MEKAPTLLQALTFIAKATVLQIRRAYRDWLDPRLQRTSRGSRVSEAGPEMPVLAESITPLWTDDDSGEKALVAGKIHNLRLAIRRIDGLEFAAGGLFSFWAAIGRAHRLKGYVLGRELREGCVVPAIAGGICQLSNALYDSAARAGFAIIERHTHTRIIPGSLAAAGRDATVFWNYLDLRFTSPRRFRIEADLYADSLRVRIRGPREVERSPAPPGAVSLGPGHRAVSMTVPENCWTCGVTECFRHNAHAGAGLDFGRTAYLVDEYWPEFDAYLRACSRANDVLALPLDGHRWGKANYAWRTSEFARCHSSWFTTAARAFHSRRLSAQGAARQRTLLSFHEKLAATYASALTFDVTHVTVMQNLLPYLWKEGHLGGRTFDVLMTSLPLENLHSRLDEAAAQHPESSTLADFRAPDDLVRLETEALRQAGRIITPHAEISDLFPERALPLRWETAQSVSSPSSRRRKADGNQAFTVAFPATTIGRKGAYQLRTALRLLRGISPLDMRLICLGPQVEDKEFWAAEPAFVRDSESAHNAGLEDADVVVLPAFVENRPRRLLRALALGIPVIATPACGLKNLPGVTTVPIGDAEALAGALRAVEYDLRKGLGNGPKSAA